MKLAYHLQACYTAKHGVMLNKTMKVLHSLNSIIHNTLFDTYAYSRFISSPNEFLPRYFVFLELSLYVTLNE